MKPKEFFKKWGEGIKAITPIQFTWFNFQGIILILVGAIIGIFYAHSNQSLWLFLILCGTIFITLTNLVMTIQKLIHLYEFEDIMKGGQK